MDEAGQAVSAALPAAVPVAGALLAVAVAVAELAAAAVRAAVTAAPAVVDAGGNIPTHPASCSCPAAAAPAAATVAPSSPTNYTPAVAGAAVDRPDLGAEPRTTSASCGSWPCTPSRQRFPSSGA